MSTYTLTLGDQAENHVGMQQIGKKADIGFTIEDLSAAQERFEEDGYKCELVMLHDVMDGDVTPAAVLVIRDGAAAFADPDELFDEQEEVEYDTKAFMYGRVVNKHLRHNVCFADYSQEPDYENKKGRIVEYSEVPLLETIQKGLPKYLGEKAENLKIEGNFYYDIEKCGIKFHGDAERRKVVAIRLGNTIPLHYQWFKDTKPVGERIKLDIEHGDIYVMSEKATGCDWLTKKIYTLRHAAGCNACTTIKPKK